MMRSSKSNVQLENKLRAKLAAAGCLSNNDIARKLLECRCSLPIVIILKDAELTKLMLDGGCPINSRVSYSGKTALHFAVEFVDIDNVKLLVERGADVNAKDACNRMPLHRFRVRPNDADDKLDILRILIEKGASLTATSSKSQHYHYLNDPGLSVLSKLLSEADSRTLRVLLPYVDLCYRDEDEKTPLHHLVKNRNPGVLRVLVGKSLCVNARDSDGRTPLDIAVFREDLEKVDFLLKNGASPNNLDRVGNPTLRYMLINLPDSEKVRNLIELLLVYGADPRLLTCNHDNAIALSSAMDRDLEFAQLLIAHLAKCQSFGVPLSKFYRDKIKSSQSFDEHFESCEQQIDKMRATTVYGLVTLYKLLRESPKRLIMYARNQEFRSHYKFVKSNRYNIHSYYLKSITVRVDEAIAIAKIQSEAACIVCEICRWPLSMADTIAYKIVGYLHQHDFENMSKSIAANNLH